jgi:hypothetical protein
VLAGSISVARRFQCCILLGLLIDIAEAGSQHAGKAGTLENYATTVRISPTSLKAHDCKQQAASTNQQTLAGLQLQLVLAPDSPNSSSADSFASAKQIPPHVWRLATHLLSAIKDTTFAEKNSACVQRARPANIPRSGRMRTS